MIISHRYYSPVAKDHNILVSDVMLSYALVLVLQMMVLLCFMLSIKVMRLLML